MKTIKLLVVSLALAVGFGSSLVKADNGWAQTLRGVHSDGTGFTVWVNPKQVAALQWDDGYPGFYATYNPHPIPTVRCLCDIFENGPRRIIAEYDFAHPGFYSRVTFEKLN